MTQKGKQGRHENAIREIAALRWEPTHVTKHCPRVVPLQEGKSPSSLCPRVFYQDYKAIIQQKKRNKEDSQIPKDSKSEIMRQHLS